jgi:hypothetical protein
VNVVAMAYRDALGQPVETLKSCRVGVGWVAVNRDKRPAGPSTGGRSLYRFVAVVGSSARAVQVGRPASFLLQQSPIASLPPPGQNGCRQMKDLNIIPKWIRDHERRSYRSTAGRE